MLQVSRPRAQRKRKAATVPTWDEDPDKLQLVYARCRLDVVTTRAVFSSPKLERLSDTERRYQLQDAAINARGVRLDRQFVSAAMELAFRERTAINLKLQELTLGAITSIDQSARFLAAVNSHGHAMTTVNKRAVAQVLAHRPDDYVRRLLELRQIGARAAVNKFRRMLAFASPHDDRLRGMLRMYGTATGRWTGLGPQLQNLKRNEVGLPLSVVDSVRSGDREGIARYGAPLALLGDISRAALCAAPGTELMSGDFSAIESVVLAWLAGETWKLAAYRTYQESGDTTLEPYRIIARRMLHKEADAEITDLERQLGKRAELAAGFGGSVGAWRRIAPHDPRTDDEIKAIIQQWRAAHPLTRRFWTDLSRSLRIAIRTEQPILVAPAPQPPIVASSEDGTLRIRLPSGRAIAYPQARLVPGKFEEAPPDIEFHDNARAQWKPYRGWFGVFVENVVSESLAICSPLRSRVSRSVGSRSCSIAMTKSPSRPRSGPYRSKPSATSCLIRRLGRRACRSPARSILASIICRRRRAQPSRCLNATPTSACSRRRSRPLSTTPATTSARSTIQCWSSAKTIKTSSPICRTSSRP
jgi:DNA polymerase